MITLALLLPICVQAEPPKAAQAPEPKSAWELLASKYDANGDGKISRAEYTKKDRDKYFARLDADGDGFIERDDLEKLGRPKGYRGKKSDKTDKVVIAKPGVAAPDFTLRILEKKKPAPEEGEKTAKPTKPKSFQLSSLNGKKPVALIFGSYT